MTVSYADHVPNPHDFTNYRRTRGQLEGMLLFSVMVAGKRADQTRDRLRKFLQLAVGWTPFEKVRHLMHGDRVRWALEYVGTGQYGRIESALRAIVDTGLDPATCTLEDLEGIPGIGAETARMFLMHSRPGQRVAALDTHILAALRRAGVRDVPRSTPPAGETYRRLEQSFLRLCDKAGQTPADFDLNIWRANTKSRRA